jgi:hypothetical protein
MQLIQLELDDWNFFCPVTGLKVFNDDGKPNAPTFRGGWCHEAPDQPIHLADVLKPLWQSYLEAQLAAEDTETFRRSCGRWSCPTGWRLRSPHAR